MEVLVDYTRDSETCRKDHYYAVTSEYETNQLTSNPFEGQSAQYCKTDRASQSDFLPQSAGASAGEH